MCQVKTGFKFAEFANRTRMLDSKSRNYAVGNNHLSLVILSGYVSYIFQDIDECAEPYGFYCKCPTMQFKCKNTIGSFLCTCPGGAEVVQCQCPGKLSKNALTHDGFF